MARFRVTLKTVVNMAVTVEAESFAAALEVARDEKVSPECLLRTFEAEGVEVSWAEEYAYALVDALDSEDSYRTDHPAVFDSPTLRRVEQADWVQTVEPEWLEGEQG